MGDEALADEGGGEAGGEAEGDDMDDGALGEGLTDKDQEEAGRMARYVGWAGSGACAGGTDVHDAHRIRQYWVVGPSYLQLPSALLCWPSSLTSAACHAPMPGQVLISIHTACPRSIIATMTDEQLDRYEAFRRSSLARPKMKKVGKGVHTGATAVVASLCEGLQQGSGEMCGRDAGRRHHWWIPNVCYCSGRCHR